MAPTKSAAVAATLIQSTTRIKAIRLADNEPGNITQMAMPRTTHHSVGRRKTGAATSQGPASGGAAKRRTLDGAHVSAGYTRSNRVNFDRIRALVPLANVLSRYGVMENLKRAGSQLRGACPIHDGSNPHQFVVNLNINTWHCFGDCQRGGGTLEFVAA